MKKLLLALLALLLLVTPVAAQSVDVTGRYYLPNTLMLSDTNSLWQGSGYLALDHDSPALFSICTMAHVAEGRTMEVYVYPYTQDPLFDIDFPEGSFAETEEDYVLCEDLANAQLSLLPAEMTPSMPVSTIPELGEIVTIPDDEGTWGYFEVVSVHEGIVELRQIFGNPTCIGHSGKPVLRGKILGVSGQFQLDSAGGGIPVVYGTISQIAQTNNVINCSIFVRAMVDETALTYEEAQEYIDWILEQTQN